MNYNLEQHVTLNDLRMWKITDVQTVIQFPNELQIYTLSAMTGPVDEIRLTAREINLNLNMNTTIQ